MANEYTDIETFKKWLPQKHIGELSNDTDGSFDDDSEKVNEALDWGADMLESKLSVRDDIPIPAKNADGSVPKTVLKFIHTLAMFMLYERRGHISDQVQQSFDIQMTWINEVVSRKSNVSLLDSDDEEVTKTTETPIIEGDNERLFDDFNFG